MLLSLADDRKIRDAAQHITATKLTTVATQDYVRALLAEDQAPPAIRMTAKVAADRITRMAKPLADKTTFGKWKNQLATLTGESRKQAQEELQTVAKAVSELLKALKSGAQKSCLEQTTARRRYPHIAASPTHFGTCSTSKASTDRIATDRVADCYMARCVAPGATMALLVHGWSTDMFYLRTNPPLASFESSRCHQ